MAVTIRQLKIGMVVNALFGYRASVVVLGLLVHPYKTVQDVVRKGIPVGSIFFPLLCWIVGLILLRAIEHFLWILIPFLGVWWFLCVWGTVFLLLWQILLVYLFMRFSHSLR